MLIFNKFLEKQKLKSEPTSFKKRGVFLENDNPAGIYLRAYKLPTKKQTRICIEKSDSLGFVHRLVSCVLGVLSSMFAIVRFN